MILTKIIKLYQSNKDLFRFMALSYLDKAIIFLIPLLVFQLFKNQQIYLSIEYIYSVTTIAIPLLDLGMSGYFFYAYRNSKDRKKTMQLFVKSFQLLYLFLFVLGVCLIVSNYFFFEFEKFIIFIVTRLLFVLATVFYASYYRLISKPEKAVYITLSSNLISLIFLFGYFFFNIQFTLYLVFLGQILFTVGYFLKTIIHFVIEYNQKFNWNKIKRLFTQSIVFSWPTILQVFIMMFIANYGKINVLTKLSLDEGTLLSLVQRFSMIIFLMHSSIWAFVLKDIYLEKDILGIKKSILYKYLFFLTLTCGIVLVITAIYLNYKSLDLLRESYISILIIGSTYFACVNAYFEMHYGRENKNIIKLYLALATATVFIAALILLDLDFLQKIAIAMFMSTLFSLLLTILILFKRNYKLI